MSVNHDKSLAFFKENQEELVKKYNGKTLVLKENQILDVMDSYSEAYAIAVEKYGSGNFSLQEVSPNESVYTAFLATPGILNVA